MENIKHGQVWVGRKRQRGVKDEKDPRIEGAVSIDVTSGSRHKFNGRNVKIDFSPLLIGPVKDDKGYEVANIFENYWQGGKVYKELKHLDEDDKHTNVYRHFRNHLWNSNKGVRHPPATRTKNVLYRDKEGRSHYEYLKPVHAVYNQKRHDYLDARKKVYVPTYAKLVRYTPSFNALKKLLESGKDILLLDIDGPKDGPGKVTVEYLREKINDPKDPFGHGYVLAGLLAGIEPNSYCE